jgi:ATP-dependent RNA helicase DeaD
LSGEPRDEPRRAPERDDTPRGAARGKSFDDQRPSRAGNDDGFKKSGFKKDGFKPEGFKHEGLKKKKPHDDKPAYVSKARRADPSAPNPSFKKKAKKKFRD